MQKSLDEKLTDELFIALCLKEQSKEQPALGYFARDSDKVTVRPLGPLPWSLTGIYFIPPLLTPVKPASISPSESRGTERAISDPGAHWTVNSLTSL